MSVEHASIVDRAKTVATHAHNGQVRKDPSHAPYIVHPGAVAELLTGAGASDEVVAAGWLHDVLEDVPPERYSRDDMVRDFGAYIVSLVESVSEEKLDAQGNKLPWETRKKQHILALRNASRETALITAADKINNIESMITGVREHGATMLNGFNSTLTQQIWYYTEVINTVLVPKLGEDDPLVRRLQNDLNEYKTLCSELTQSQPE